KQIFSSSPIPGNGASINKVINQLTRAGANVLTNSVFYSLHSSGHPSKQELRIIQKIFKPKYFMPVHGEYRMLRLHSDIAVQLGMPRENTFILSNGDQLLLKNHEITEGNRLPADDVYIDGKDINGLSTSVIKDRKILSEDGMVAVLMVLDSRNNRLMTPPRIYTRGFVALSTTNIIPKAEAKIAIALDEYMKTKVTFGGIKELVKSTLSKYFFSKTQRNPYIIPVIMNKKD
ncbi:MAG: ribonuclease J, partial [Bacilli bacterium]|nr:ribonuclease J [Bacilli bacterium]